MKWLIFSSSECLLIWFQIIWGDICPKCKYGDNFVGHLKSDDFFSTDKYTTAEMVITAVKEVAANKYEVKADFTVKGKKVNEDDIEIDNDLLVEVEETLD